MFIKEKEYNKILEYFLPEKMHLSYLIFDNLIKYADNIYCWVHNDNKFVPYKYILNKLLELWKPMAFDILKKYVKNINYTNNGLNIQSITDEFNKNLPPQIRCHIGESLSFQDTVMILYFCMDKS